MSTLQAGTVLRHIRGLASRLASTADDRQLLERFTAGRDEPAFAELVRRHGPMVLGVCRRVLHNAHDADDAFQATFLVLVRKAGSISRRESVGGWLYQVAYNMALRARGSAAARQRREQRVDSRSPADPLDEVTGRELLAVLDEELARLPQRQRAPLVLCYLGGKTRDEAARELGCSLGTLKRRLDEGRERLRERLGRRGLALPAALLGAGVAGWAVPPALAATTARAAAGQAAIVSAQVARLVRDSLRALTAGQLKTVGAALLAVALVGAGLLGYGAAADPPQPSGGEAAKSATPPQSGDAKPAEKQRDETTISGRVLDPDGKPAAGAKVYLLRPGLRDEAPPKPRAEADKDGRFSFTAPPDGGQLFATAPGYGPAGVRKPGKLEDNPLRLARDDVPVSGRVLDLQGQPVAGATVRVHALKAPVGGRLDNWLAAVKVRRDGLYTEYEHLPMFASGTLAPFFPPITTDKDGRFRIQGLGRDRAVALIIEGPTIETKEVNVVTRPGVSDVRVPAHSDLSDELLIYHPPTFAHVAAPCRVLTGAVRDKATGKPLAGAVVRASDPVANPAWFVQTTADKDGRFRLTGLARKRRELRENALVAMPPDGEPYLAVMRRLPEGNEAKPAALDFDLPRGVWLEGQVKDKAMGRGVEARLGYHVFAGGPDEAEVQSLYSPHVAGLAHTTDREGKFRLVAAPCRGVIGARAMREGRERYCTGAGADKIDGGTRDEAGDISFRTLPHTANASDFDALVEVKPEKGATSVRCDLVLDPGRTLTVQVRGPDGKPLHGTRANGQSARGGWESTLLPAEFSLYGLAPGKGRTLLLQHPGKNLAARYEIKGDERGPVVVTLRPAATVTGRLVDEDGRPLGHAEITVYFRPAKGAPLHMHSREFRTDADGKFRIDGLLPGMSYSADVLPAEQRYRGLIFDELSLNSGETKDFSDVKPRKGDEE